MIFIAFLAAVFAVYYLQRKLFFSKMFDKILYDAKIDTDEVFAGDDFYLYEELTNDRAIPVPYIKVNNTLPKGLKFRLAESDREDRFMQSVQSVFVLHRHEKIRRRWRVNCTKRGVYCVGNALLVSNDIFGLKRESLELHAKETLKSTITVLPRSIDLAENFSSSRFQNGDVLSNRRLLSEPFLRAGTREYVSGDSMRSINWKLSASHNKLLVNLEEYTQRRKFNVFLNMNSREIEYNRNIPSDEDAIERCITVCASVVERVCSRDIGIRFIMNAPAVNEEERGLPENEIGEKLFFSHKYEGRGEVMDALRMLANLKLEITCPINKVLDHILENHEFYCERGGLLFVTAYFEERMVNFARKLRVYGVQVVFYVTTASNNTTQIPNDIEVYFQTHF